MRKLFSFFRVFFPFSSHSLNLSPWDAFFFSEMKKNSNTVFFSFFSISSWCIFFSMVLTHLENFTKFHIATKSICCVILLNVNYTTDLTNLNSSKPELDFIGIRLFPFSCHFPLRILHRRRKMGRIWGWDEAKSRENTSKFLYHSKFSAVNHSHENSKKFLTHGISLR